MPLALEVSQFLDIQMKEVSGRVVLIAIVAPCRWQDGQPVQPPPPQTARSHWPSYHQAGRQGMPSSKSFNGKFRDGCLNPQSALVSEPADARHEIDQWRARYNHVRPHGSLSYLPPSAYAQRCASRSGVSNRGWTATRGKVRGPAVNGGVVAHLFLLLAAMACAALEGVLELDIAHENLLGVPAVTEDPDVLFMAMLSRRRSVLIESHVKFCISITLYIEGAILLSAIPTR